MNLAAAVAVAGGEGRGGEEEERERGVMIRELRFFFHFIFSLFS